MASITDLATASSISGTVYGVINQDGTDKKITPATLIGGALTGGGTLATGGFTLTVPATGTVSLLGTAQTFTAKKTFGVGLAFNSNYPLAGAIADNAVRNLSDFTDITGGFILIMDQDAGCGLFLARGGYNTVTLLAHAPTDRYGVAANSKLINFYYDGAYVIQNKYGSGISVSVVAFQPT